MKGRFLINMKIGEEIFFSSEKNLKGVCEWEMAYEENPNAEEFKVYEKNNDGLTYSLIHSTYKRKIGFQEVKKCGISYLKMLIVVNGFLSNVNILRRRWSFLKCQVSN